MNTKYQLVSALVALACLSASAQVSPPALTNQHADMLVSYQVGAIPPLSLLVRDDDNNITYASNQVVLAATEASQFTMPFDVPELGLTNGQTFWWLPQTLPPSGTLFLGLATAGVPPGTFTGPLAVRVLEVSGPGRFFVWQDLSGGGVSVLVDSADGLGPADSIPVNTAAHDHVNWGLTVAGVYCVTFRVDGNLTAGGTSSSLPTTWVFHTRPLGIVTPYELWTRAHWLQGVPAATNAPDADPDGDDLCNAIEYASNLHPNVITLTNRPTFSWVPSGGQEYGAWTFTRVKSIPDIIYEPVATIGLNPASWEPMTNVVSITDGGAVETRTVRDHQPVSSAAQRFLQYRVRLGEP